MRIRRVRAVMVDVGDFRAAGSPPVCPLDVAEPNRAVFVGDRPWDDITGAQGAGLRAVLRRNRLIVDDTPVGPDGTIDSLPELLPLIDSWRT